MKVLPLPFLIEVAVPEEEVGEYSDPLI